jgi:hypothetical protein
MNWVWIGETVASNRKVARVDLTRLPAWIEGEKKRSSDAQWLGWEWNKRSWRSTALNCKPKPSPTTTVAGRETLWLTLSQRPSQSSCLLLTSTFEILFTHDAQYTKPCWWTSTQMQIWTFVHPAAACREPIPITTYKACLIKLPTSASPLVSTSHIFWMTGANVVPLTSVYTQVGPNKALALEQR